MEQNKELYSVSEVAKRLQISSQAVYKKIASEKMKDFVILQDGKKYINSSGFDILSSGSVKRENPEDKNNNEKQVANLIEEVANQKREIEELKRLVAELQNELKEQKNLTNSGLIKMVDLVDQQQKLQAMQMQNQAPKKSFLQRLLGGE